MLPLVLRSCRGLRLDGGPQENAVFPGDGLVDQGDSQRSSSSELKQTSLEDSLQLSSFLTRIAETGTPAGSSQAGSRLGQLTRGEQNLEFG